MHRLWAAGEQLDCEKQMEGFIQDGARAGNFKNNVQNENSK